MDLAPWDPKSKAECKGVETRPWTTTPWTPLQVVCQTEQGAVWQPVCYALFDFKPTCLLKIRNSPISTIFNKPGTSKVITISLPSLCLLEDVTVQHLSHSWRHWGIAWKSIYYIMAGAVKLTGNWQRWSIFSFNYKILSFVVGVIYIGMIYHFQWKYFPIFPWKSSPRDLFLKS